MAVQSRIDADDEWFVGEDRVLRFTFPAGTVMTGWTMAFELYPRRAAAGTAPVLTVPATAAVVAGAPVAVAQVDGDVTTALGPGVYQFVLRRVGVGSRAVLSFGPVELLSAVNA